MNTSKTMVRWLAGIVLAVELGTAVLGGSAVASADTASDTSTVGTNAPGSPTGTFRRAPLDGPRTRTSIVLTDDASSSASSSLR